MKHILTLAALVFATACFGQEACPNVHDINANGTIDIEDFLSILGLFADVDVDEDGVWDSEDACIDLGACNYDAIPSEPCAFIDVLGECGGGCEGDGDGDGICDDVDTCVGELDECGVCNGPGPTELIIEDIVIDYDSIYLPLDEEWFLYAVSADTIYGFFCGVYGCTSSLACNYNASADQDDGSCVFADEACEECADDGTVLLSDVDGDGVCDQNETNGCTIPFACNYNEFVTEEDGSCEFLSCIVFGCTQNGACNYDPEANYSDSSCEYITCQGCTNPLACNYDDNALVGGLCEYESCTGCSDPDAYNFDEWATIQGPCVFSGCTDMLACNYEPSVEVDDGSCHYSCLCLSPGDLNCGCTNPLACNFNEDVSLLQEGACDYSCLGCTDESACNYDTEAAGSNLNECVYPGVFADCDGDCLFDFDNNGICDEYQVYGCVIEGSLNFNPDANVDNGTCIPGPVVFGCLLPYTCNYDPNVTAYLPGACDFSCLFGMPWSGN